MLTITATVRDQMVAACLAGYPLEACGLLGGIPWGNGSGVPQGFGGEVSPRGGARATACYPATNAAASSRVYTVEPRDMLRADRAAEAAGLTILGVWHSHTHTDAYPSPTDIAQAPDPDWWYVLVSLRDVEPVVRAYRIRDGAVEEVPIAVQ